MLKPLLTSIFGTRHDRELKRVQPIVAAINAEYERLHDISDDELRGQTGKLRGIIRERTAELEAKVAELKELKKQTADPDERDRIDDELSGKDGRGGVEGDLREQIAE